MKKAKNNQIPYLVIYEYRSMVKTLSDFICFRKKFINGIVWGKTAYAIHKGGRTGLSLNTIQKQIKIFSELGWIKPTQTGYYCVSKTELYRIAIQRRISRLKVKSKKNRNEILALSKKALTSIPMNFRIPRESTGPEILVLLRQQVVRNLLTRQKTQDRKPVASDKVLSRKTDALNGIKDMNQTRSKKTDFVQEFFQVSYSVISSVICASKTTAFNTIKNLCSEGKIRKKQGEKIVHGNNRQLLSLIPNSFLTKTGYVMTIDCNSYLCCY